MIFVERPRRSVPTVLKQSDEKARVIAYYENGAIGPKVEHKVYKKVKEELVELFKGKCAYCETELSATFPGDAEHFRPKSNIGTVNGVVVGYYWKAADWDNLVLSCDYCNRARWQKDEKGNAMLTGKQTQFPLSDEKFRCTGHKQRLSKEEPYRLLLDPCKDKPEDHLLFTADGVVQARELTPTTISKKGEVSIEVLGLHRFRLVQRRRKHFADKIRLHLDQFKTFAQLLDQAIVSGDSGNAKVFQDLMANTILHFQSLLKPDNEYLALTREILGPLLRKLNVPF